MVNRPYKCPLCQSVFRSESGMNWHLAHRHEIPAAFDALGKDYEAKATNLLEENALLKKKVAQLDMELEQTKIALVQEQTKNVELMAKVMELNKELQKAAIAIAGRDHILEERLNIEMPNPFETKESD